MHVQEFVHECHKIAKEKGWWETPRAIPEILCLIHSEVSEALEEYRDGHEIDEIRIVDGKPEGFPVEIADVFIRLFDMCGHIGINIEDAIRMKIEYNKGRSHRHGGKKA